jgi:hypothetical protein
MRWTIFCTLLLITAFIVIYRTTTDIWIATNGAGIIAVIFLIGVAFRVTRIFDRRWQKITTALLSVLLIGGLLSHWIIMWKMTEWQYTQLQVIRRVIYNGEVISTLRTPADDTFREFRGSPPGTRIGEVFRRFRRNRRYGSHLCICQRQHSRDDGGGTVRDGVRPRVRQS